MRFLLEFIVEVLLDDFGPREESRCVRLFIVLAMGIAGTCFLAFAGIAAARMDISGILGALFLVGLAALCFWLVWRGKHR